MNDKLGLIRREQTAELEQILGEMIGSGKGTTLLLSGEAGTGKTMLMKEFIDSSYETGGRKLVSGYGFGVDLSGSIRSYHPWKEAIIDIDTNLLTMHFLHGHPQKETDYKKVIKSAFEGTGTDWIKAIPQVGNISALIFKTVKEIKEGISEQKIANAIKKISEGITFNNAESLFETISAKLRSISEKYPLIVFIDDLQWIDNSSRDLFLYIAQNLNQSPYPLLLAGAYRTEELAQTDNTAGENESRLSELVRSLKKIAGATVLEVSKLSAKEAGEIILSRYPGNIFSRNFSGQLLSTSGGNIAIFCQVLENLENRGDIVEEDGKYTLLNSGPLTALPANINELFAEKWERLSDDVRSVLRIASVMGEDFSVEIISELLEENKLKLFTKIESLKNDHKLITGSAREYGKLNMIFQFKNTLFRRFVYETIDEQFRSEFHKQISEALKKSFKDIQRESIYPQYINHFGIGNGFISSDGSIVAESQSIEDESVKVAYDQYLEMMERLAYMYSGNVSNEEALSCYDVLVRLTKTVEDRKSYAKFRMLEGKILTELGRSAEAESAFNDAFSIITEFGDDRLLADVHFCLGNLNKRRSRFERAWDHLNTALQKYESTGNEAGISLSLLNIGNVSFKLGKFEDALEKTKSAVEILVKTSGDRNLAMAYLQLGNCYIAVNDYSKAAELFEKGMNISEETSDLRLKALFTSARGVLNFKNGQTERSLQDYSDALKIQESISNVRSVAILMNNIAVANHYLGKRDISREYYLKAKASLEMLGDSKSVADILYNIADLEYIDGQYADAKEYAERAVETLLTGGFQSELTKAYNLLAKIERDKSDSVKALESAREGEKFSESSPASEGLRNEVLLLTLEKKLQSSEMAKRLEEIALQTTDKELVAEVMTEKALILNDSVSARDAIMYLDEQFRINRNPLYSKLRERIDNSTSG